MDDGQRRYWDTTGTTKTFTHPLEPAWLDGVDRDTRVLDYGCGYGRLAGELAALGFTGVEGVDIAPALVRRARAEQPGARFSVLEDPPRMSYPDASFGAALLFAVLTCIPSDEQQRALAAELHRVLAPGGLLYVSDLERQDDERYRRRYGPDGVFQTDDGAVVRHHAPQWWAQLFARFDRVRTREEPVRTMNGNPVAAVQLLLRKR